MAMVQYFPIYPAEYVSALEAAGFEREMLDYVLVRIPRGRR